MNKKTFSIFLLAGILVAGTISMTIPNSLAQPEHRGYEDRYGKVTYDNYYNSYEDPCQSCFEQTLTKEQIYDINTVLAENDIILQTTGTLQPVGSLDEVCAVINNVLGPEGQSVTDGMILNFFIQVNAQLPTEDQIPNDIIDELIQCLLDAELIRPGPGR